LESVKKKRENVKKWLNINIFLFWKRLGKVLLGSFLKIIQKYNPYINIDPEQ
jgi:hypothetical protein